MPVYAYQCEECGVRFERHQSFHDDPITICPECEGDVRRLIQPAGIIFKGGGFYVTDNKSKNSAAPGKTETKTDSTSETTSSSTDD